MTYRLYFIAVSRLLLGHAFLILVVRYFKAIFHILVNNYLVILKLELATLSFRKSWLFVNLHSLVLFFRLDGRLRLGELDAILKAARLRIRHCLIQEVGVVSFLCGTGIVQIALPLLLRTFHLFQLILFLLIIRELRVYQVQF